MNPRLVAISGPLKGQVFDLSGGEATLGRGPANSIPIADMSVSRHHCALHRKGEAFRLGDLSSRNGTFVNGLPVNERDLAHGDRLELGDSAFLFLTRDEEEPAVPDSGVRIADHLEVTRATTLRLRSEDALYLHRDKIIEALPPSASRKGRDLDALLRISRATSSIHSRVALAGCLLDLIFEVIPAERGAILKTGDQPGEFDAIVGRDRTAPEGRTVDVSRTMVRQALEERTAILANDVLDNAALSEVQSLVVRRTTSVLAAPLIAFERPLGVIYLDTRDRTVRFDRDHLELITGIASLAAVAFDSASHFEHLETENRRLQEEIRIEHNMVGESQPMRDVYAFVSKVAPRDSTVLIAGESGTGKELVARAIHDNSPRRGKPFVAINCAALTETLLESELFGHEKGAFTGAVAQVKGKLEVADGGTVFLDEIGELAPSLQAKLLRFLQEREFERVGSTRPVRVDIRLIAASNRNLEEAIRAATFRQDLFFRLNVVSVTLPPLRERRDDVPLLASYSIAKYSRKCRRRVRGLSPEARACLVHYDWPGNVRELENAIERAVVLGSGELILLEDLPESLLEAKPPAHVASTEYHAAVRNTKRELILKAVEKARGNFTEAAKLLGVHPNYLHRLVNNLNLRAEIDKDKP